MILFCTVCEQMDVNEDFSSSYAPISFCTYIITGIFLFTINWHFWLKLWNLNAGYCFICKKRGDLHIWLDISVRVEFQICCPIFIMIFQK